MLAEETGNFSRSNIKLTSSILHNLVAHLANHNMPLKFATLARRGRRVADNAVGKARLPTCVEFSCDSSTPSQSTFLFPQNPRSGSDASVIQPLIQAWDLVKVGGCQVMLIQRTNPKLLIADRISGADVR